MLRPTLLCVLAACASGPSIDGTWEGTCVVQKLDIVTETYALTFEIEERGGDVEGTATVHPDWMDQDFVAPLTGSFDDPKLAAGAELEDGGVSFVVALSVTWDGADAMAGACNTDVAAGDAELARVP